MKLYEIAGRYSAAMEFFDNNEDLPQEAINDTLSGLDGEFDDKAIAVASYIKNIEAEAEAIKNAEKSMAARRKAIDAKAARLREYLISMMKSVDKKKVSSPYLAVSTRKNPPKLIVDDSDLVPATFKTEVITTVTDNKALKKALLSDDAPAIEGAHIERNESIVIK